MRTFIDGTLLRSDPHLKFLICQHLKGDIATNKYSLFKHISRRLFRGSHQKFQKQHGRSAFSTGMLLKGTQLRGQQFCIYKRSCKSVEQTTPITPLNMIVTHNHYFSSYVKIRLGPHDILALELLETCPDR